ncbi:MAG TPA: ATP-binding protein [Gaiellales bacterium]|nr:ATP-binding protein [Gaiellales bacterium]
MALTQSDRPAAGRRPEASLLRTLESSRATAPAVAAALVLLSTLVTALVTPTVPYEAAGVIYLVGVLGVSSIYGLWWGLVTSVASALAYNFFFLPPAHTLVINSSSDWAALAAFVLTALVTSNLASRARSERDEAARRAAEARLSESFATLVADADDLASVLPTLASQAARSLGATDGVIHRGTPSPPERRGAVLPLVFNDRWMGELRMIEPPQGALDTAAAERVARSLAGLIALGEERERRIHQQVQAEALSRSDELKTALLRAVSHDLRSPLMAISTAAGGLRYAGLDDEDRELLETITEQTGRMNGMIENLLDLSKLQAGAVSTRADWIDLRELVEASADELARRMPEGGAVDLEFDADLPLVRGDAPQLQRVLVNLLENARKFSPPDQPVQVTVRRRGSRVDLSVADRGPGVTEDEAERIFEPFYRSPERRDVPGSGLGLAIARGLAEANSGTLAVERRDGGGSTFTLTLPVPAGRAR